MIRKIAFQICLLPFPWGIRRRLLNLLPGFAIAASARIGKSLIAARTVTLATNASIGHLSLFRNLDELTLDAYAIVGNSNRVVGVPTGTRHYRNNPARRSALIVREHAAITNGHLIDCSDTVTIGSFSILAGWGSQILTHAIEINTCRQETMPVSIGHHCFIGSRALLLKGANIADRCVIAAGSVVTKQLEEAATTYAGVPAKKVGAINPDSLFFTREVGYVE